MKKIPRQTKEEMVRKTYHLPKRITNWIDFHAGIEGRSSSNFLATFLKGKINGK